MEPAHAANAVLDTRRTESGTLRPIELSFEQHRRIHVCNVVLGLWDAAQRDQLSDYLQPIPVTRLHAAHRAFFEIGAMGVVHVLRWGLFHLRRVGAPKSFSHVVAEMTTLLLATADDVHQLIANYKLREPLSPSGVRVWDQQTHRLA
jgi:hypothetical protein